MSQDYLDHSEAKPRSSAMPEGSQSLEPGFLQSVIDAVPEATIVLDLDYRIVMANKAARLVPGTDDWAEDRRRCFEVSHHRDAPCEGKNEPCPLRAAVAGKKAVTVTHKHFTASGKVTFVEVSAVPIFDETGEVVRVVESQRDVSEHKWQHRILEIGNRHVEMKPMLDEFVDTLTSFIDSEAIAVRVIDQEGCTDQFAEDGFPPGFREREIALSRDGNSCVCARVMLGGIDTELPCFTEGGSFRVNNLSQFVKTLSRQQQDVFRSACHEFGYESVSIVPIRLGEQIIGLLQAASRQENAISSRTVETLESVAVQLGTAIRRVRMEEDLRKAHDELEEKVQQRTEQLTAANKALQGEILERESAETVLEHQAQILRQIRDAVVSTDADGYVTSWNRAARRLLGYTAEETLGKHITFMYPEYWREIRQERIIDPLKQAGEHQIEVVLRRKTGEEFHADLSLSVIRDAKGEITGVICCASDISRRKRLEQEVLQVGAREQQRIGRELHDDLGQELTGLAYLAKSLHGRLVSENSPEAEIAADLAHGIPEALAQTQRIVKDLVPMDIAADTLPPSLQTLAANVEERSGVVCRFVSDDYVELDDDDSTIHMYRIAQEAINNAVKHGNPQNITVSLKANGDRVALHVHDDGTGIDPEVESESGSGLRIMQYRARVIGATLDIKSNPDEGTLVICTLRKEKHNE